MSTHEAFLRSIIETPDDDAPRLVYADWLEDNGDADRAEFLRVCIRLEVLAGEAPPDQMRARFRRVREIARLRQQLRGLRDLVPRKWALRLSRGWIEQCNLIGWGANCPRRWELLLETDDPAIRRCGHCNRIVLYCWSASAVDEAIRSGHPLVKSLALDRG